MAFSPKGTFLNPFECEGINISDLSITDQIDKLIQERDMSSDYFSTDSMDPYTRGWVIDIARNEYPLIFERPELAREFDQRFEERMRHGEHPERAVHHVARGMMNRYQSARPDRPLTAREFIDVRARQSGKTVEQGRIHEHERSMRELKHAQMRMESEITRTTMEMVTGINRAHFKKKELNFVEQLRADVDEWLKDSLKLTHLDEIKL